MIEVNFLKSLSKNNNADIEKLSIFTKEKKGEYYQKVKNIFNKTTQYLQKNRNHFYKSKYLNFDNIPNNLKSLVQNSVKNILNLYQNTNFIQKVTKKLKSLYTNKIKELEKNNTDIKKTITLIQNPRLYNSLSDDESKITRLKNKLSDNKKEIQHLKNLIKNPDFNKSKKEAIRLVCESKRLLLIEIDYLKEKKTLEKTAIPARKIVTD